MSRNSHETSQSSSFEDGDPRKSGMKQRDLEDSGFHSGSQSLFSNSGGHLFSDSIGHPFPESKGHIFSGPQASGDSGYICSGTTGDSGYLGDSGNLDSGSDISERMESLKLKASEAESINNPSKPESTPAYQTNPEERLQLTPASSVGQASGGSEKKSPLTALGLSTAFINLLKEIFRSDDDGDTQLHYAVLEGFVEAVWHITRLIPHQALLDLPNNSGRTALHLAVASGDTKIARHLIVCGASPVARDNTGSTPLHIACYSGNLMMVDELTHRVRVDEVVYARLMYPPAHIDGPLAADLTDYDGQTCMHVGARGGHMAILKHLSDFGADVNAKDLKCGRTPLHYAVELRDPNLISFLVGECRAALNVTSYAGLTPYQLAAANEAPAIATVLLELGASSDDSLAAGQDEPDDDELDLDEESNGYADNSSQWVEDLRFGSAMPLNTSIPVTTSGPLNMDLYM